MTSSQKSQVPFANTIRSFQGSMFGAEAKPWTLKELLTHTLNCKTEPVRPQSMPWRWSGEALNSKTASQKLCRLPWNALLGACSVYATFRGFSDKNSEAEPVPQNDLQTFHLWACLQTARSKISLKVRNCSLRCFFRKIRSQLREHHHDLSQKAF